MPRFLVDIEPGLLLILIRHGATQLNDPAAPRVRGWDDTELSDSGKLEVQMAAEKLKQYDLKQLYHSDFMRDSQTAQIIGNKLNINADTEWDARTWDTGLFSGQLESVANPAIFEIYKRPWQSAPGGSESMNEFLARWQRLLDSKIDLASRVPVLRPLGIVSHGRPIAATDSYVNDKPLLEGYMPYPAGFALLSVGLDRKLNFEIVPPQEPITQDV